MTDPFCEKMISHVEGLTPVGLIALANCLGTEAVTQNANLVFTDYIEEAFRLGHQGFINEQGRRESDCYLIDAQNALIAILGHSNPSLAVNLALKEKYEQDIHPMLRRRRKQAKNKKPPFSHSI